MRTIEILSCEYVLIEAERLELAGRPDEPPSPRIPLFQAGMALMVPLALALIADVWLLSAGIPRP